MKETLSEVGKTLFVILIFTGVLIVMPFLALYAIVQEEREMRKGS